MKSAGYTTLTATSFSTNVRVWGWNIYDMRYDPEVPSSIQHRCFVQGHRLSDLHESMARQRVQQTCPQWACQSQERRNPDLQEHWLAGRVHGAVCLQVHHCCDCRRLRPLAAANVHYSTGTVMHTVRLGTMIWLHAWAAAPVALVMCHPDRMRFRHVVRSRWRALAMRMLHFV